MGAIGILAFHNHFHGALAQVLPTNQIFLHVHRMATGSLNFAGVDGVFKFLKKLLAGATKLVGERVEFELLLLDKLMVIYGVVKVGLLL